MSVTPSRYTPVLTLSKAEQFEVLQLTLPARLVQYRLVRYEEIEHLEHIAAALVEFAHAQRLQLRKGKLRSSAVGDLLLAQMQTQLEDVATSLLIIKNYSQPIRYDPRHPGPYADLEEIPELKESKE